MKIMYRTLFLVILYSFCLNCVSGQKIDGELWKSHLVNDLLPFWTMPDALGNPIGNFPTYRCENGGLKNCDDIKLSNLAPWVVAQTDSLRREYIRTRSRQTFFYGVAYHLTGNETYIYYAQCGVNYIRKQIRESGLIYSWSKQIGNRIEYGPDSIHVTTQDLAGSLVGLSFYYYLTHDKEVLNDILKVKEYVFRNYIENDGYLKWSLCPDTLCSENKTDLAAYLEQVNDYLLLITPLIENESIRDNCIAELRTFCQFMQKPLFYNSQYNMIWAKTKCKNCIGTDYADPLRIVGASTHTDYGQTARTYWNMYLMGKLLNEPSICDFAYLNGVKTVHNAFLPNEGGAWALSPFESNTRSWWLHAELDEAAALFSLIDTVLNTEIVEKSYSFWFNNFVDKKNYEVFSELNKNNEPIQSPKVYHWKNAFHTGEHALFGYIVSSSLNNENADLYFAYNKKSSMEERTAKPYYFDGKIAGIETLFWNNSNGLTDQFKSEYSKSKISFAAISAGRTFEK